MSEKTNPETIVITSSPESKTETPAPTATPAAAPTPPPIQVVVEKPVRRYLKTKLALAATATAVVAGAVLVYKHMRASDINDELIADSTEFSFEPPQLESLGTFELVRDVETDAVYQVVPETETTTE
jgi:hypothetical protein